MSFNITNTVMLGVFLQQVGSVCSIPPLTNYVDTGICKISEEPHQCFEPLTATCPLRNFQPSPEMVVHLFQLLPVFKDSILPSSITEKSSLDSSNNNALLPPVGSVRPFQIETVPLIIMLIINPLIYFIIALMQMILGRFLRVLCCIRIHHWMSQTPSQSESAASQESLNLQMLHHLLLRLRVSPALLLSQGTTQQTVWNGDKSRPLYQRPLSKKRNVRSRSKVRPTSRQSSEQLPEAGGLGMTQNGTNPRLGISSKTESSNIGTGTSAQPYISPLLTPQSEISTCTITREWGQPSRRRSLSTSDPPRKTALPRKRSFSTGDVEDNEITNSISVPTSVLPAKLPPVHASHDEHPNENHPNKVIQPVAIFDDFICSPVPQEIIFSLPDDSASDTSMIPSFRNVLISPEYMGVKSGFSPQSFDPGVDEDMVQPVDANDGSAGEMVIQTLVTCT